MGTCTHRQQLLRVYSVPIYTPTYSYDGKLNEAKLLGAKKGFSVGAALFLTFFFIFLVDSAAFWFGAYLISRELSVGGDVITVSHVIPM